MKTYLCLECSSPIERKTNRPRKFCCRTCQNSYNARKRRHQRSKCLSNCRECGVSISLPQRVFCSKKCKNAYGSQHYSSSEATRRSRTSTPERYLKALTNKKRRRDCGLTPEHVVDLFHRQRGLCALTGVKMTHSWEKDKHCTNMSIDRIDSSKGYEPDNVQLVCTAANIMKFNHSIPELRKWCALILAGTE